MDEDTKNQLTQLWQRLVAVENKHIDAHLTISALKEARNETEDDINMLAVDIETLKAARKVQISLNEQFKKMMKANPDKNQSTSSWWKKLW